MTPSRGELWWADLDPTRGGEQAGRRPVLVVSTAALNRAGRLAVVAPCTRTARGFVSHVAIEPPEGGVRTVTHVMCEQMRAVATARLGRRIGAVAPATMASVADRLRMLLDL